LSPRNSTKTIDPFSGSARIQRQTLKQLIVFAAGITPSRNGYSVVAKIGAAGSVVLRLLKLQ